MPCLLPYNVKYFPVYSVFIPLLGDIFMQLAHFHDDAVFESTRSAFRLKPDTVRLPKGTHCPVNLG
jgi:hypothetical protein